ncbi:hypothetical protein LCGC14_1039210 [marine sediment metagenome]|uniref:SprT-like domain-containing protein n=1 Tax=marine sediment metagenome TaxID=412755 RepID=A0A0F9QYD4_9ZZZZ
MSLQKETYWSKKVIDLLSFRANIRHNKRSEQMKKHLKLDDYLSYCGLLGRVINTLEHFAKQRNLDASELFAEFNKYRMVRNTVTSRSGQIRPVKKQVELHTELLREGREEHRDQTLLHETAHLIIFLLYPESLRRHSRIKVHGREWKIVMRHLGCRPDRCSNHDFLQEARIKKAKLMYACQRCEEEIPAQRRWKNVERKYHKRCRGGLYLKRDQYGRTYSNPSKAAA